MRIILPKKETCCFIGPRRDELHYPPYYYSKWLIQSAESAYQEGYRNFIAGLSPGIDHLASAALDSLTLACPEMRIICAIPYRSYASDWPPNKYRMFIAYRSNAAQVVYTAEQPAPGCWLKRSRWMIDRSSRVYAVCEEGSKRAREAVDYALGKGVPLVLYEPPPEPPVRIIRPAQKKEPL